MMSAVNPRGMIPMTPDMMSSVKGNRPMPCSVKPPGMIKLLDLNINKIHLNSKEYKLTQYNQTNQYLQYDNFTRHTIQLPRRVTTSSGIINYQGGNSYSIQLDFKSIDGKKWMEEGIVEGNDILEKKAFQKFVDIDRWGRKLANLDEDKRNWIWFSFIKCSNKKDMNGATLDDEYWPPSVKLTVQKDFQSNQLDCTCIDGRAVESNAATIRAGETEGKEPLKEFCDATEVCAKSQILPVFSLGKIYKRQKTTPMSSEAGMHLFLTRCTFWRPDEVVDDRMSFFEEEDAEEDDDEQQGVMTVSGDGDCDDEV